MATLLCTRAAWRRQSQASGTVLERLIRAESERPGSLLSRWACWTAMLRDPKDATPVWITTTTTWTPRRTY